VKNGNSVKTVWGGYVQAVWSEADPGPSQLGRNTWSAEAESLIAPSGGTGSSGSGTGEPGFAVVGGGSRFGVRWERAPFSAAFS
jgi:hypothetical protein